MHAKSANRLGSKTLHHTYTLHKPESEALRPIYAFMCIPKVSATVNIASIPRIVNLKAESGHRL